jgi:sugar/nucleoside kinase (ribokinase family)
MGDVWILGSAAWDHVYEVDHLPAPGGAHALARNLGRRPGGGNGNIARALASAGHTVHLVALVGTDELGDDLVVELASYGVDTGHMLRSGQCTPETLVFVDRTRERSIFVIDKGCAETVPVPDVIADADAVFVGRFADYEPRLPSILRHSRAMVVAAVPPPGTAANWCADIVVDSASEFTNELVDHPYQHLRKWSGDRLRWVLVTSGAQGVTAYGPDTEVVIPAVETVVVDTTGAGDAFTAGLMHGLLQGKDIATAGALGVHWAAVAVGRMQSVPPRWDELQLDIPTGDWAARLVPQPGRHQHPGRTETPSLCK